MCGSKSFCRGCFSNLRRLAGKTILIHELCFLAALRPVLFALERSFQLGTLSHCTFASVVSERLFVP